MKTIQNLSSERLYWVAKEPNGNIRHTGFLDQNQVLTTALDTILEYNNEVDQIEEIENFIGTQPAFNYEYNEIAKEWYFPDRKVKYLPVASHISTTLNNALCKLIKPSRNNKFAGTLEHATWPNYDLFVLNDDDEIPIDSSATATAISNILQISVNEGGITQQELTDLVDNINNNKGNKLVFKDFIPNSWQQYLLSESEAESAGYVPCGGR